MKILIFQKVDQEHKSGDISSQWILFPFGQNQFSKHQFACWSLYKIHFQNKNKLEVFQFFDRAIVRHGRQESSDRSFYRVIKSYRFVQSNATRKHPHLSDFEIGICYLCNIRKGWGAKWHLMKPQLDFDWLTVVSEHQFEKLKNFSN